MLAISSRNSVPSSASSKQPMRSMRASVNAPFTWPNSSLSAMPSDEPAGVHRHQRLAARAPRARAARLATTSLPVPCSPVMSTDGVRRRDALDRLPHARIAGASPMNVGRSRRAAAACSPPAAAGCAAARAAARSASAPQRAAVVVPRLLDVVARAAAHRLDRAGDAAPGRSSTSTGSVGSIDSDPLHQVEALLAGRRVARVVQVEEREVEVRAPRAARAPRPASAAAVTS